MKKIHLMLLLFSFISFTSFSQEEKDEVFLIVESMPVFHGCEDLVGDIQNKCTNKKIQEYTTSITYPKKAIKKNIEGKVYISFVIDQNGEIIDVKLLRGTHKLLDAAAIAHIQKMPKFVKAGFQRGKSVKVKYNIPISFLH